MEIDTLRSNLAAVAAGLLILSNSSQASDTDVRVIVSGEIAPGVYGRVDIGGGPPPPVLYAEPMVIVRDPKPVKVAPVYMHVPPGHAKNWKKHCQKYNACGLPVYFVKSAEYEPKKKGKKE